MTVSIPHNPSNKPWYFESIPGAVVSPGTVNYLYIWQVLDVYPIVKREYERTFTSFLSSGTWCDFNFNESRSAFAQSDHPELFKVAPVNYGEHEHRSPVSDVLSAQGDPGLLVREASHEDYPAWRSQDGKWVLQQACGSGGAWHSTLRLEVEDGSGFDPPVWISASSWCNRLGGLMAGSGLPEIEIQRVG